MATKFDALTVKTSLGAVRGRYRDEAIRYFCVPYAKPPTGLRRFVLPQPLDPWRDCLDATVRGTVAPQNPSRLDAVMGSYSAEQSEDCLHLTLWAPYDARTLPVIVFIHGGGFTTGGGALACYDGTTLALRCRSIVVNVSYRLGALGFLPIPGVAPANLGLYDQIAALRWIRDEIEAFGGDARNVTVIGQSAGALSVAALLTSPRSSQLFDRAILMSAPLGLRLNDIEDTRRLADAFLRHAGAGVTRGDGLREASISRVLKAQAALHHEEQARLPAGQFSMTFGPVIDHVLLHGDWSHERAAEQAKWCPLIMGTTRDEYSAYLFHSKRARASDLSRQASDHVVDRQVKEVTDSLWTGPVREFARRHSSVGGSTYVYSFDWASNPHVGACHCIDLPFLFRNFPIWKDSAMMENADFLDVSSLSSTLQDYFSAFSLRSQRTAGPRQWPSFGASCAVIHFKRAWQADG